MKYFFKYGLILFLYSLGYSQIEILKADVATITNAGEGDYYITTDTPTDELYVGMADGTLKPVGIITITGTNEDDYLTWNTTTNQWEIGNNATDGELAIVTETIRTVDRSRALFQGAVNVNQNPTVDLTPNNFQFNEIGATINGNNITNIEGNIRLTLHLNLVSSGERTNFNCTLFINGNPHETLFSGLYARNSTDNELHDSTGSTFIFEYENAILTDTFRFQLARETTITNAVTLGPTSKVLIDRYTESEAITHLTARANLDIGQGPQGLQGPQGIQGPQGPQGPINPEGVYHAYGRVSASGAIINQKGINTVARVSAGNYRIDFTAAHNLGTNYPILFSMEQNAGTDDYVLAYTNITPTGFNIEVKEHDDGGNPGVFRDTSFSFYVPF